MSSSISDIEGGYPKALFKAGTPPAFLFCAICMDVARNAHRCAEEHVFCLSCIQQWLKKGHSNCPMDRSPLGDSVGRPLQVFRMAQDLVNDLEITCPNVTAEDRTLAEAKSEEASLCKWTGKVREELAHFDSCSFRRVPCKWSGCSLRVRRDELTAHMSKHDLQACPHCQVLYPKRSLQDAPSSSSTPRAESPPLLAQHIERCSKRPQKCPNAGCETTCMGGDMMAHRKICKEEIVPCPYANMGCTHTAKRTMISSHANNMAIHFEILMTSMVQTKAQVASLSQGLMHTQIELECLKLQLSDQQERFTSGYFYWQLPPSTPLHLNNLNFQNNIPGPAPPGQRGILTHIFRSVPGKIGENSFSLWLQVNKTVSDGNPPPPPLAPQPTQGTIGLFVCIDNGASLPPGRHCAIKAKVRVNSLSASGVRTPLQDCHMIVGALRPPNFTIGRQYSAARPEFMPSYETLLEVLARGDTLEFGTFLRYEIVIE
mgnify:CR=1 FL=1